MSGQKARVLIVDDDRTNINVLGSILQTDYEISVAMSGEQALRLLASGLALDIILLDIQMPDMSGIEVARAVRSSAETYGENASTPILAITGGSALSEEQSEYQAAGINGVVLKPVSPQALKQEMERLL